MSDQTAIISISRHKSSANFLRQFAINIDGRTVGKIKSGQTKLFKVPSGAHSIRVKLDFYKSKQLIVDLKPHETIALECGDRAPETLGEAFTLKGFEKSMNSLLKPDQYLYVSLIGSASNQNANSQQSSPQSADTRPTIRHEKTKKRTIFISYRREDSREITGRICDRLTGKFGKETIFRDVDSIPAGVDFREHISKTIDRCNVLVAVIGNRWLEAKNRKGELRLEHADDPLSVEIETALKKEITVIPVLVKGAIMPDPDYLPERIKPLAFHNAIIIPMEPYFHAGVDRLIDELEKSGSAKDTSAIKPGSLNYCIYCGIEIVPGNKFCIQCGKPV